MEFDSERDDEEIDEETAFTAEDEKRFSHVFDNEEIPVDSDVIQVVDNPNEVSEILSPSIVVDWLSGG